MEGPNQHSGYIKGQEASPEVQSAFLRALALRALVTFVLKDSEAPPCPGRVSRQGLAKLNLETKCQRLLHYLNASLK